MSRSKPNPSASQKARLRPGSVIRTIVCRKQAIRRILGFSSPPRRRLYEPESRDADHAADRERWA